MIWKKMTNDVRKSTRWALICNLIAFIIALMLARTPTLHEVLFLPALIAIEMLEYLIGPQDWLWFVAGIPAQFFGYFLFIYLSIKILRQFKKITGKEFSSEEKLFIRCSIVLFVLALFNIGSFASLQGHSLIWWFYLLACFGIMIIGILLIIAARNKRPVLWKLLLANSWLVFLFTYFLILKLSDNLS